MIHHEMASTSRATICDLPNEVVHSIFSFLPVSDLAQCAVSCKRWHAIVSGCTDLWEGKEYRSYRSPTQCAETRAVLYALPPFQNVSMYRVSGFMVHISYPRLVLSVKSVRVVKDFPQLRCEYLWTRVEHAGEFLFSRSTVDLERLRQLDIEQRSNAWAKRIHKTDYVIRRALTLCPSLTHLGVFVHYVSVGYLSTLEALGQLQSRIKCPRLQKLSFLRHFSGTLAHLQLLSCESLPSRELAELRQLWNLRTLRLTDCRFEEGDLAAAVAALASLESLQLHRCRPLCHLSFLQRCRRLRKLRFTWSSGPESPMPVGGVWWHLQLLRPPTDGDCHWPYHVVSVTAAADDLPAALSQLQQMGLSDSCCGYLASLSSCCRLRHVSSEFVPDARWLFIVRIHITLTKSM